jgi:hypothetical protein
MKIVRKRNSSLRDSDNTAIVQQARLVFQYHNASNTGRVVSFNRIGKKNALLR